MDLAKVGLLIYLKNADSNEKVEHYKFDFFYDI